MTKRNGIPLNCFPRGRELRLVQGRKILGGEAMGELRLLREWEDFWGPR
jgi:hypothetical protein